MASSSERGGRSTQSKSLTVSASPCRRTTLSSPIEPVTRKRIPVSAVRCRHSRNHRNIASQPSRFSFAAASTKIGNSSSRNVSGPSCAMSCLKNTSAGFRQSSMFFLKLTEPTWFTLTSSILLNCSKVLSFNPFKDSFQRGDSLFNASARFNAFTSASTIASGVVQVSRLMRKCG